MSRRILVVEDNEVLAEVFQDQLKVLGYEVTLATDGLETIRLARLQRPDLILMDLAMPSMDGFETAAAIHNSDPDLKIIPILAATARSAFRNREKWLAAGYADCIAKPFTHRELGSAIHKLLARDGEEK